MGRWTQYDEDDSRLPEGMKRVGYDADSGRYYFRDAQGVLYSGEEGVEFGEMTPVAGAPAIDPEDTHNDDLEAAPTRSDGYQPLAIENNASFQPAVNTGAYRTLFPFFLIVGVVLLLIWRLILSPATSPPRGDCPETSMSYWVRPGESCWEISKAHGCQLDELIQANPNVDCDRLLPGTTMCLPGATQPSPSTRK